MRKTFCDCCGEEIEGRTYDFKIFCHISLKNMSRLDGKARMINGKMHNDSGREDVFELCLPCYNQVMYSAWDIFNKVRNEKSGPEKSTT